MGLFGKEVKLMEQDEILVDIQNLSKSVQKQTLLSSLDYQLPKGEILALCGGNGAGKSTLIRLLTGTLKPTLGHVKINQLERHTDKNRYVEQFGYMPDHFHFQHSMTTKETISFYARIKKIDKQRYEEVLSEVGLIDKLHVKVGTFSKGMNQRLLLAQALLTKPNLLILDEPTNGLDPYWITKFTDLMLCAKADGQTIIFSTHDLHVAEKIADKVIFLQNGEVISKGPISKYNELGLYETFQRLYLEFMFKNEIR